MNKGAELVSDSLLRQDFITIKTGRRAYTVYPPSIKVLSRALSQFAKIGMGGEYSKLSVLAELKENIPFIISGLSFLIVGDVRFYKWRARRATKGLNELNLKELKDLIDEVTLLLGGEHFFACAASLKSTSEIAAKPKL